MSGPDDGSLRAGDADRQAVAERLRVAQDEGRITLAEYDERLGRAYAAATFAQLRELTADLPDQSSPDRPSPDQSSPDRSRPARPGRDRPGRDQRGKAQPRRRAELPDQRWRALAGFARVAVLLIGIWAVTVLATGHVVFFWPLFPLVFCGLAILSRGWSGPGGRG